jgi:TctA family transporter
VNDLAHALSALGLGFAALAQPANAGPLLVGALAGAVLAWLTGNRVGGPWLLVAAAAALAQSLEPLASVLFLAGAMASAAGMSARPASAPTPLTYAGILVGLVGALVHIDVFGPWLAATYRALRPLDRCILGAAAMILAWSLARGAERGLRSLWPALWLCVGFLLAAFDGIAGWAKPEVSLVALGLLGAGPLIAGLTGATPLVSQSRGETAATMLPWFMLGAPVTVATALMADALGSHGLTFGPQMLVSRAKLGWGMWAAMLVCVLWGAALSAVTMRVSLAPSVRREQVVAAMLLAGTVGLITLRAGSAADFACAGLATIAGIFLSRGGYDPSQAVVGLVIGQLTAPSVRLVWASGGVASGSGVQPLVVVLMAAVLLLSVLALRWQRQPEAG